VRWGERTTPLGTSELDLPPCDKTGLELVEELRARKSRAHAAARAYIEEAAALFGEPA
jgi:hypothetical protein